MLYRFYNAQPIREIKRETPAYEVFDVPHYGRWPENWEWSYDFPDIKTNLNRDFRRRMFDLSLRILQWCGANVRRGLPEYIHSVQYVQIDSQKVIDVILNKLSENKRRHLSEGAMILVGAKELRELVGLSSVNGPIHFVAQKEYGEKLSLPQGMTETHYYMINIPIVVLPDFVGVAVIPDLTGTASKKLLNPNIFAPQSRPISRQAYMNDDLGYAYDEYEGV